MSKKKVTIVYQVSYETEIEVETDLREGVYNADHSLFGERFTSDSPEMTEHDFEMIDDILDSVEVDNIVIPENETSFYRKQSFEITSFEIV